ncbi:uncharacterized protein LOC120666533 isoform X2 [Panicum virgatum]|nr:uncharacterized protein LOC120666533 isoform X2 [Panicum virgatum]
MGPWGNGYQTGNKDIYELEIAPLRLESITVHHSSVIEALGFSYRDRENRPHTAGPWGKVTPGHDTTVEAGERATDTAFQLQAVAVPPANRCPPDLRRSFPRIRSSLLFPRAAVAGLLLLQQHWASGAPLLQHRVVAGSRSSCSTPPRHAPPGRRRLVGH